MAQCVVSENTREACKMSKVDVVIGCFYGDEGKGKDVCYIAYDSCPLCLLIREIIL